MMSPRVSFPIAVVGFVAVFAAAGAPIPVYRTYQVENGITTGDLAHTAAGYLATTLVALLFLGRLSDHVGRKPIMLASLLLAAAGTLTLIGVNGLPVLLAGRALLGLAAGLAASGLGAFVIETAPPKPAWLPTMITGSGPMIGIPAGALLCGLLVETAPQPRSLTFTIIAVLLLTCAVLLAFSRETRPRSTGAWGSLRPRLTVPRGAARLLFSVGAAIVAGWAVGGFYQAFAPEITADHLGTESALAAAAVFSSILITTPFGSPLAARIEQRLAIPLGAIVFALAVIGAFWALLANMIIPFLAASLLAGLAQGVFTAAGTRALLGHIIATQRGAMLSTIYIISYTGAAAPALIAGTVTDFLTSTTIFAGYLALVLIAVTATLLTSRTPAPRSTTT